MSKKKTHAEYEQELFEREIDHWPLEEYNGSSTPILHECLNGHKTLRRPSNVLSGADCLICRNNKTVKSHESYLEDLKYRNIEIIPTESYTGVLNPINHKCSKGHVWKAKPDAILHGSNCPICYGNKKHSTEEYLELIKDTKYTVLEAYINNNTKIKHKCPLGHIWSTRPSNVLSGKGCPDCAKAGGYNPKFFENNPEVAKLPGLLYCVVLTDKKTLERKCLKIGITKGTSFKNIKNRANHFTGYNYSILKEVKGTLLQVYNLEQQLHNKWKHKRYASDWKFAGWTELFELDPEIIRSIPNKI